MKHFTLAVAVSLCACNFESGSSEPEAASVRAQKTPAPASDDLHAAEPVVPGTIECESEADCYPQQAGGHGTWCGPEDPKFKNGTTDAPHVPGTLDYAELPDGQTPGCRCVKGRCGARLNDGILVIGPQPRVYGSASDDESGS